ncbi:major facilitator superfamily domain-containing protein [Ilyonectria destructans]|nr:major facilitator superfamily domain-containing protein [Ilyonectria destructans]
MSVCVVILPAGTVICIAAPTAETCIVGRALAGLGMAALVPLAATMLGDITTPNERPVYFALIVGLEVLSLAIGSPLGGALDTAGDYRWGFAVTLVIKLLAFVFAFPFYERDVEYGRS